MSDVQTKVTIGKLIGLAVVTIVIVLWIALGESE